MLTPRKAPTTPLAHEIQHYQQLLEHHRMRPDDEDTYHQMLQAKQHMEIAWLNRGQAI